MSEDESGSSSGRTHDPTHDNSLYKSIDIRPGHVYEVIIKNNDPKSVLTWDFDVVKNQLHFTVYRTSKSISSLNGTLFYILNILLFYLLLYPFLYFVRFFSFCI